MAEKKSKKSSQKPNDQPLYTIGEEAYKNHALPDECFFNHGLTIPEQRSFTAGSLSPNLKSGHSRWDVDYRRPEDKLPTEHAEIIQACQAVYRKIGLVRNVIDLMCDFASEGIELRHPTKSQERVYRKWAEKVNLNERARTFMKLLLRDANVIIRRKMAYITQPVLKDMKRAQADIVGLTDVNEESYKEKPEKITKDKKKSRKNEIPWKYVFFSPAVIEKIGGNVGKFLGENVLGMRITTALKRSINSPKTKAEEEAVKRLPPEIYQAVQKGDNFIKLNPDQMYIDYYNKDDWEDWGTPFLYGVLEDIMVKEKMRLADMAALDGVINVVRLWKLGDHEKNILPSKAAVNRLVDILQHNVGGGVMDLVWDSMIDLHVEYPPTDKILGAEKYTSVNSDIVRGLGIPDSLLGGVDLGTRNAESAYVQLKTLTERLEYIRARCIIWLENELRMVADALGFKNIPHIVFGTMALRDEAAEKQLLIQLLDRGVISIESVLQTFGHDFVIELERLRGEDKIRSKDEPLLEKADPYHRPKSVMDLQQQYQMELYELRYGGGGENLGGDQPRDEEVRQDGRPPNTKDTAPRDERTEKTLSVYKTIAEENIEAIDKLVDPLYLKSCCATTIRSLTKEQKDRLEKTKRAILATIQPGDKITKEIIEIKIGKPANKLVAIFETLFSRLQTRHTEIVGKSPNLKDRRSLAASTWAMLIY